MPTGRVKWYDVEKGFGFLSQEDGEDVYVRSSALAHGVTELKAGQKVEFGMAEGRRGPQALTVTVIEAPPSVVETSQNTARIRENAKRRPAEELHGIIEDMIKLVESTIQPELQRGRYPDRKISLRASEVLCAVAKELD